MRRVAAREHVRPNVVNDACGRESRWMPTASKDRDYPTTGDFWGSGISKPETSRPEPPFGRRLARVDNASGWERFVIKNGRFIGAFEVMTTGRQLMGLPPFTIEQAIEVLDPMTLDYHSVILSRCPEQ